MGDYAHIVSSYATGSIGDPHGAGFLCGRKNVKVLEWARAMGDYLVKESNTPDEGKYPRFTRSTGRRAAFPQPPDAGTQDDRPYEIQPDKGGIALQVHGGGDFTKQYVRYRNIRVKVLD